MKTLGQKLSPVLIEIEETLWEFEADISIPPKFTDEGFRAATKIFMSALMDKMWVLQEKENMPLKNRAEMSEYAGNTIHKFIKEMTGIDMKELYKL